ncbi:DUF1007 family protein [Roseitalea sp. MMSF_3504]|nr:DUF1007 family protein [Roseitalea sp. MMSF_3504]
MTKAAKRALLAACAMAGLTASADTHPHVFAEARLEVTATPDGMVDRLRHVWRFDPVFSSTVLFEFDADGSNALEVDELEEVARTVSGSIAEFGYFQSVTVEGKDVAVAEVTDMRVDMIDGQLLILFTSQPVTAVALADNPSIAVYDPTFYTAIDFYDEANMVLIDAPAGCSHQMVIPDPDEAIAQNQDTLTEAFFNDPEGNDWSKIFATRMEVSCT